MNEHPISGVTAKEAADAMREVGRLTRLDGEPKAPTHKEEVEHLARLGEIGGIGSFRSLRNAINAVIDQYGPKNTENYHPTHEDMADEYANKEYPLTKTAMHSPELYSLISYQRNTAYRAFLAGRKSATIPPETT